MSNNRSDARNGSARSSRTASWMSSDTIMGFESASSYFRTPSNSTTKAGSNRTSMQVKTDGKPE